MPFVYEDVTVRKHHRLPHWDSPQGLYFITFRLKDAIPLSDFRDFEERKRKALLSAYELQDPAARDGAIALAERRFRLEIENCLDEGYGSCILALPAAATAAHEKLIELDQTVLSLIAHAIMPNHVHTVFRLRDLDLGETMKRVKGGCSYEVNQAIGRKGTLWQGEYYDTLIRDERHLDNAVRYVMNNPGKAGLAEWPWTYASEKRMREVLGLE